MKHAPVTRLGALRRVTVALADTLTPEARGWVVGWLVGAMARGLPVPHVYALARDSASLGPLAFSDSTVFLEWDFCPTDGSHPCASLECGQGEVYMWLSDDLWRRDGLSHDATVRLDGPTTARVVTVLRAIAAGPGALTRPGGAVGSGT